MSVGVSGMIESTYEESINETIAAADQTVNSIEAATAEAASEEAASGEQASGEQASTPLDFVTGIPNAVGDAVIGLTEGVQGAVTGLIDEAQKALNGFIEALAVMVVTSCIIPIVVLVFFLWLAKIILGVDVSAPAQMIRPRFMRRPVR